MRVSHRFGTVMIPLVSGLLVGGLLGCSQNESPGEVLRLAREAFRSREYDDALRRFESAASDDRNSNRVRMLAMVRAAVCVSRAGVPSEAARRFLSVHDRYSEEMAASDGYHHSILLIDELARAGADEDLFLGFANAVGEHHPDQREALVERAELHLERRRIETERLGPPSMDRLLPQYLERLPSIASAISLLEPNPGFRGAIDELYAGAPDSEPWMLLRFRRASDQSVVCEVPWEDRRRIEVSLAEHGEMTLDVLIGGEVPFLVGYRFHSHDLSGAPHVLTPNR